jgi:hypothetical protein
MHSYAKCLLSNLGAYAHFLANLRLGMYLGLKVMHAPVRQGELDPNTFYKIYV